MALDVLLEPMGDTEAADRLRARAVLLPDDFQRRVADDLHQLAFTVAGIERVDRAQAILDSLVAHVARGGMQFRDWQQAASESGFLQGLSDHHVKTIYQNAYNMVEAQGRWAAIVENAENRPYLVYDTIIDGRERLEHRLWDGIILPWDHPFWRTHFPPNGHNCRCKVSALTAAQARARGLTADVGAAIQANMERHGLHLPLAEVQPDRGWAVHPAGHGAYATGPGAPALPEGGAGPTLHAAVTARANRPVNRGGVYHVLLLQLLWRWYQDLVR